ncbi:hypothetical protein [Streptomyces sp. NPDC001401]|uniref:hypothetical protein n=1 Tax=Streptomyces sp. NPDC001401 TaxID=3364570 RepID=UPI0036B35E73
MQGTQELLADASVNLNVGEIDAASSDRQGPMSISELTVNVAQNLREAMSEIEAFAKDLGVELPKAQS